MLDNLKSAINIVYHTMWYLASGIILALAIIVTLIRLVLPEISDYHSEIKNWINQSMDSPVQFSDIKAEWTGWTPNIILSNLSWQSQHTKSSNQPQFGTVRISIAPIKSLYYRKLIAKKIFLSHAKINLIHHQDDSIIMSRLLETANSAGWILNQADINIEQLQIHLTDTKFGIKAINLVNTSLKQITDGNKTQIDIHGILNEPYGNKLRLALDLEGELFSPNWVGQIYLEIDDLNINTFFPNILTNIKHDNSKIRLWSNWRNGKLINFYGKTHYKNINIISDANIITIPIFDTKFYAARQTQHDWYMNLNLDQLKIDDTSWPSTQYSLHWFNQNENKQAYSGRFGHLDIKNIVEIASTVNLTDWLAEYNLLNYSGTLQDVVFTYIPNASDSLTYSARFSGIEGENEIARFAGAEGHIYAESNLLTTIFHQSDIQIKDIGNDTPILFSKVNGRLELDTSTNQLHLNLPYLDGQALGGGIAVTGHVTFYPNHTPEINLLASIEDLEINNLISQFTKAVPTHKQKLLHTLKDGYIKSASLLASGHLNDFPFPNSTGVIQGDFNIEGATLNYLNSWPELTNVAANIFIHNDNLKALYSGKILQKKFRNATVSANHFLDKHAKIESEFPILTSINHGIRYLKHSPFKNNSQLSPLINANGEGDIAVNVKISKGSYPSYNDVQVAIEFIENTLELNPQLTVEQISGEIKVVLDSQKKKHTTGTLNAIYDSNPILINVKQENNNSNHTISGYADSQFITKQLKKINLALSNINFEEAIQGKTLWSLELSNSESTKPKMVVRSNLKGLELNLPPPFKKEANQVKPLFLDMEFDQSYAFRNTHIKYSSDLQIDLEFKPSDQVLPINSTHKKRGAIYITAIVSTLNILDWLNYINHSIESSHQNQYDIHLKTDIEELIFLGYLFEDLSITLYQNNNSAYQLELENDSTYGEILFPHTTNSETFVANINHLKLTPTSTALTKPGSSPITLEYFQLSAFDITINQLAYKEKLMGKFSSFGKKSDGNIQLDELTLKNRGFELSGTGNWRLRNNIETSHLLLDIKVDTLGNLLELYSHYGGMSGVEQAATQASLDFSWSGSPADFSLETLSGTINLNISEGRLEKGNTFANKIFNILNIYSIYDWLNLDFSSLASSEFKFENISGELYLKEGNAYTENFLIKSNNADIQINGRTELSTHDYEQHITVYPKISSSLPVTGALFGPIGAGVGTILFLADRLFDTPTSPLLNYQYSIKGNWSTPAVKHLKEPNPLSQRTKNKGIPN